MPAFTIVVLDTTAPSVTLGEVEHIPQGTMVSIPYEVDEAGILEALVVDNLQQEYEVTVTEDELQFIIPGEAGIGIATLTIVTQDDVLNERTQEFELRIISLLAAPDIDLDTFADLGGWTAEIDLAPHEASAELQVYFSSAEINDHLGTADLEEHRTAADLGDNTTSVNLD